MTTPLGVGDFLGMANGIKMQTTTDISKKLIVDVLPFCAAKNLDVSIIILTIEKV